MEKFMQENRKQLGNFEIVDFPDEAQVAGIREKLDIAVPLSVRWNHWEYGSEVSELRALHEKGKLGQWNASVDVDWSVPVTRSEWIANPEMSLLGQVTKLLGKDEATQQEAVFDEVNYLLSQLLHGEQGLGHRVLAVRGSSASRSASPNALMATTVSTMARPGNTDIHQRVAICSEPSWMMFPQVGVGGRTPMPR